MKKIAFFLFALWSIQTFSQISISKDNSFGDDGIFLSESDSSQSILSSNILILPDNSILYIINNEEKNFILKLKPNGTLDPSFGDDGKLQFNVNNFINAVLQGDKIIVYFGPKPNGDDPYEDSKIIRYDKNGTLDTTFGNNGVLNEITESINPQALSVVVLKDQSLVVTNSNAVHPKKFTKNGLLDSAFGNNGEIIYSYHFPLGQFSNGKIATCDISSLTSSIYSFYDLNSLNNNTVMNLNDHACHHHNGVVLQNKSNLSTRMTDDGTVYSTFEYKNYPLPDFSRLIVMKNENINTNFNENGFVTSDDDEQFLDSGFSENLFFVLSQKDNKKALKAYSNKGTSVNIDLKTVFDLTSGNEIEMKNNYILVNSILSDHNQNFSQVKIEKFIISNNSLSTSNNLTKKIEIENPVKDKLNIKNAELAEYFEIYGVEGSKILESKTFQNMNVGKLLKGNYILKIKMKNGENFSKKLIKY